MALDSQYTAYELRWSEAVLAEAFYHLRRDHPGAPEQQIERWRDSLDENFPEAKVTKWDPQSVPRPKDPIDFQHCLDQVDAGIEVKHVDDFLCMVADRSPALVRRRYLSQVGYWQRRGDLSEESAADFLHRQPGRQAFRLSAPHRRALPSLVSGVGGSLPVRYVPLRPVSTGGDMDAPRTSIRLVEPDDAGVLAAHLARDAEAFARWDPERPPEFYTAAGQCGRIEGMLVGHGNGQVWPGVVLADDVVIGQITAQNILRGAWRKAELGYWIAYPHQGQGHATRAVGLAVRLMAGELGLHRAEAYTQTDNLGSQQVLRNNGFVPCGTVHSRILVAGTWRDQILWERLLD